ncbi:MAG: hypothetical protein IPI16_15685 [Comamonadaceae bacterium]|nr:hypothetical protein [Comamonadaceae bacterium]
MPGWPVDKISKLPELLKVAKEEPNPLLDGLVKLLDPSHNLVTVLSSGKLEGDDLATLAANDLMARARALAARETFFHWWTAFPTVFGASSGFDAIIGNPPWDRIKLQEVEWFAERDLNIAAQPRAADRKRLIGQLQAKKTPLWASYVEATERAGGQRPRAGQRQAGQWRLPAAGRRRRQPVQPVCRSAHRRWRRRVGWWRCSPQRHRGGQGRAEFFRSLSGTGRLGALFDFENRKVFFPDVDSRFKFCALLFGGTRRTFEQTRCAFFLHRLAELDDSARLLVLTAADFLRVNPNTGAAPIFRSRRDADITLKLYARHPVLVKHGAVSAATGKQPDVKAWPVKYVTMFHMTNDSSLFHKAEELEKRGWTRAPLNRWVKDGAQSVPLYEGKMVQMFDHRAADVVVNAENLHRAAQPETISQVEKASPNRYPQPQFFVEASETSANPYDWALGYKEISAPTNARSMIATMLPAVAFGNKVPLLIPQGETPHVAARTATLIAANFNCFAFDFVLRQKLQVRPSTCSFSNNFQLSHPSASTTHCQLHLLMRCATPN